MISSVLDITSVASATPRKTFRCALAGISAIALALLLLRAPNALLLSMDTVAAYALGKLVLVLILVVLHIVLKRLWDRSMWSIAAI